MIKKINWTSSATGTMLAGLGYQSGYPPKGSMPLAQGRKTGTHVTRCKGLGGHVSGIPQPGADGMKLEGFLLLLAGWGIALAAVALLRPAAPRLTFVLAGIGVEILGLVLVVRSHLTRRSE